MIRITLTQSSIMKGSKRFKGFTKLERSIHMFGYAISWDDRVTPYIRNYSDCRNCVLQKEMENKHAKCR